MEYWLTQKKRGKKFSFQWIEVKGDKIRALHREYINNNRLDVEHGGRDKNLKKTLHKKTGLPEDEILEYLEELGLFIGENQHLLKVTNKRKGRDKPVGNRDKKEAVEDPVPGYLERALELIKSEDPLQEVTDYIGRNVKHDETLVKLA
ncbi:MAG TPA: hypothetical protein PKI66_07745, partial [Methanobacteriaceae archaeon]|nr:hypothetical protein [Methanobacteriaceae archaeon]